MKKGDEDAIKIISASIFELSRPTIPEREWSYLSAHLEVNQNSIYCIEYLVDGFNLTARTFVLRYHHSSTVYGRKVMFQKFTEPVKRQVKTLKVKPPIKFVELVIHKGDAAGEGYAIFNTVQELAEFLRAHPIIAEEVGYVPKRHG